MILKASMCLGNFVPNNKNKYKPVNTTGAQLSRTQISTSVDVS